MFSATQATWIGPIPLAYVHTGPLGSVGVIAVDEESRQVVAWTSVDQNKAAARSIRAAKEPYLTQNF